MLLSLQNRHYRLNEEKLCHDSMSKLLLRLECLGTDSHPICDSEMRQFSPLSMDWHPDGNLLLCSDEGGFVRVFELEKKSTQALWQWPLVDNAVFDVKWRPSHPSQAVASSGSWSLHLMDVPKREIVTELTGHQASVRCVSFSPHADGNLLASGSRDGTIRVWDLRQEKAIHVIQIDQAKGLTSESYGQSPRTRTGLIGSPARSILVADRRKYRNAGSVAGLSFLDQFTVVSCSDKQGLSLWDLRYAHGGRRIKLDEADPSRGLVHISTDSVSRRIAVMSCTNSVYVIDVDLQRVESILTGSNINSFYIQSSFSPDGKFLVAGSSDKIAPIWSLGEAKSSLLSPLGTRPMTVLDADDAGEVSVVAWNPIYPGVIATASDSFSVRVWRPRIGSEASRKEHGILGCAKSPPKVQDDDYAMFGRMVSPMPWHRVIRREPQMTPSLPGTPPVTPQADENLRPSTANRHPPATMPTRIVHRTVHGNSSGNSATKLPSASATNAVTPKPNRRRPLSALGSSRPSPVHDLRKWFQPQQNDK